MKKTKLIWGIVLICIGALSLAGIGGIEINKIVFAIICCIIAGVGVLLIIMYRKESQKYLQQMKAQAEKVAAEQRLEDSRKELEQARIDAELAKIEAEKMGIKTCPSCGAPVKGNVCEYCGQKVL